MLKLHRAFYLSELLIVKGIIGLLALVLFVFYGNTMYKVGDTKTTLRVNGTNIYYQNGK